MFRNPAGLLNVGNIERASCIWLTELLCEAQLKSVWMCVCKCFLFLPVKNINNKQYKIYKTVKLAGFENCLPQSAAFIVVFPPGVAHVWISAARQQEVWNTSSRSQRFSALLWLFLFLFLTFIQISWCPLSLLFMNMKLVYILYLLNSVKKK